MDGDSLHWPRQLVARLRENPVVAKKSGRRCAMADGFNLHANVRIGPLARDSLERLSRYILRPALCNARLHRLPDGRILAKLKRKWSDGTTVINDNYFCRSDDNYFCRLSFRPDGV